MQVAGQPRRTLALQHSDPIALVPRRGSRSPLRAQSVVVAANSDRELAGPRGDLRPHRFLTELQRRTPTHEIAHYLRAQLVYQEQQMTVIFEQAQQSAAANMFAENAVVFPAGRAVSGNVP